MRNILQILWFFLLLSNTSIAQTSIQGEIIVAYHQNIESRTNLSLNTSNKSLTLKEVLSEEMNLYLYKNESDLSDISILEKLENLPEVRAAQLNYKLEKRGVPNDALYGQQWNLEKIKATEAWELTTGGTTLQGDTIVIMVIDEGIDVNHEDLKNNLWYNYEEIPNDNIDNDNNGLIDDYRGWNALTENDTHIASTHGTPVAGIIGAKGNNGIGMSGVNWNVKIMMYSLDATIFTAANVIKAYNYALQKRKRYNETNGAEGAFVVATNLSGGIEGLFPSSVPIWCEMYDHLGEEGILSAASVDNRSAINVEQSGDIPTTCTSSYLVTVTDTNLEDERRGAFGNTSVDIAAPGTGCYSVQPINQYGAFGGTSCAAPHVAGAVGLLYAMPIDEFMEDVKQNPSGTALKIKNIILGSVDVLDALENEVVSEGRLNLYRSLMLMDEYYKQDLEELTISRFFPNPATDFIQLDYISNDIASYSINIYNTLGQLLYQKIENGEGLALKTVKIDLSTFQRGIYFLSLHNNTGQATQHILTKSFIVQ